MIGKQSLYWDACIFVAWLKNEQREDVKEMDGIYEMFNSIERGNVLLLTSLITRIEILECTLSHKARENFEKLFQRKNFQEMPVNQRIAELARTVRNSYQKQNIRIRTPDTIHLATAIHYNAEKFYTFDESLLKLNGNIGEYPLTICNPKIESFSLKSQ
jgi:predicted nucleic acid-binding protein